MMNIYSVLLIFSVLLSLGLGAPGYGGSSGSGYNGEYYDEGYAAANDYDTPPMDGDYSDYGEDYYNEGYGEDYYSGYPEDYNGGYAEGYSEPEKTYGGDDNSQRTQVYDYSENISGDASGNQDASTGMVTSERTEDNNLNFADETSVINNVGDKFSSSNNVQMANQNDQNQEQQLQNEINSFFEDTNSNEDSVFNDDFASNGFQNK